MVKNLPANAGNMGSILGQKIPWRRKWQPTPVFLPRKSHGQRSLTDYRLYGVRESDMAEHTCTHAKRWGGGSGNALDPRQGSMQEPRTSTLVVMSGFLLFKTIFPKDTYSHPLGEGTKVTSCGPCSKVGSGEEPIPTKINPVTQASCHPWAQIH